MTRSYRFALVAVLFTGAALYSGTAFAQNSGDAEPSEETVAEARAAYSEAEAHYEAGRFAQAEIAFWRAYNAVPNAVILVGIARSQAQQGNYYGAAGSFERYLRERPDPPDRAAIEAEMAEFRTHRGVLTVTSTEPGADIAIDGEPTGEVTPAEIEVVAGDHMVRASRPRFTPVEEPVQVSEEGTEVVLNPEPPAGSERVVADGNAIDFEQDTDEDGDDEESGASTAVWVTSGIAAAGLVSGTVLGFLALSAENDFNESPSEGTADRGERMALFADVSFAVAGAAAITAIIIFLTQDDGDDEDEEAGTTAVVGPMVSPYGGGVSAQVGF